MTFDDPSASASVLLVDDMPANLLALQAALSPLHVHTVAARSGKDALDWVERQPFAVALVDVQMPGMDGFELSERLRKTRHGREMPIMFVTAVHSDEHYAKRGYATGAADYITKPYDSQIVRARVKAFVDLYEQREGVRKGQVALRTRERDQAIRRLVAFERIASAALETERLDELLDELLQAFIAAADAADSASIWLRDGEWLRVAASIGGGIETSRDSRILIGRGFAGLVASDRKSLEISEDAMPEIMQPLYPRTGGPRALYGVPLLSDGQVVGVAQIGSERAGRFSKEEKKLFSAAAERAALAMAKQLQFSRLNEILSASPDYIAIVGSDALDYKFANASLRSLFGEELIGKPLGLVGFPAETRGVVEHAYTIRAPVQLGELAITEHARGKAPVYVRFRAQPLFNASGRVDQVVLFGTDITEQVQARKALEQVQAERAELLERERTARHAAELASSAKDEFLATVSHELRTPLSAILGWASLARTRPNGDIQRALAVIERNALAQARIVEDVLDFSRMLKGKLRLVAQKVELTEVVRAALESVRPAAEAKQITLDAELEATCTLIADSGRLQQVVWNLLANAVKYTGHGGHVRVQTRLTERSVELRVSDTGQGIEADFLPYVFEAFRQANGSTTRRHGGLGLGLSIVRQIVQAHGGSIEADSAGKGRGSVFTLKLPTDREYISSQEAPSDPQASVAPELVDLVHLNGIKVMVVDDDRDGGELMAQALSCHGAEVTLLPSAEHAVRELASLRPHVLVSDIAMPDVDGYELIRRVRELRPEEGGKTPALAVSAHAGKDVVERVLSAGFQRYASKPVDIDRLLASVAELAQSVA